MSAEEVKNILAQKLALRKEVSQKLDSILRAIPLIESGELNPLIYSYKPHNPDLPNYGVVALHPTRNVLMSDWYYLQNLMKSLSKEINDLKVKNYKLKTKAEIDKFHIKVRRSFNKLAKAQMTSPDSKSTEEMTQLTTNALVIESNGIIGHLVNVLEKEPTRKNIKAVLEEVAINMSMTSDSDGISAGLSAVKVATFRRLRFADRNLHPESNPRHLRKFADAIAMAQMFGLEIQLVDETSTRLINIIESNKNKRRKIHNDF